MLKAVTKERKVEAMYDVLGIAGIVFGLKIIHDEIIPKSNPVTMSITISWIHAIVTGAGAFYVQLTEPTLFTDAETLINESSQNARILIFISLSYFVYDFLDMLLWSDYSSYAD